MRSLKIFAILIALNMSAWLLPKEVSAQETSASYQTFYDGLSPYGNWVDYPNYGYVWIPDVDPGFSPYATNGHWVFTDDGWTWVSDYPWGWAPFHYGRWDYDNNYGWFWIPDDEWGPAWVTWRRSPGYYGWAPLGPGISISVAIGSGYYEPSDRWIFVRDRDITRSDVSHHYINRSRNVTIINNSTVIVNTRIDDRRSGTYITGPDKNDVQKFTRTPVKSVVIKENDRPGQKLSGNSLQIYRPQVQKVAGNGKNLAPSKVVKLNDVKPIAVRNVVKKPQKVAPTNNRNQQPQKIAPTNNKNQQLQQVAPIKNRNQQTQKVATTNKRNQQPQKVAPTSKRNQQPQKVAPTKNMNQQPQRVAPTNNRNQQQQKVAPPKNNEPKPNEK